MATKIIELNSDFFNFSHSITLDGKEYIIKFVWNTRDERTYCSLFNSDNVQIAGSEPLLVGTELFARSKYKQSMYAGKLILRNYNNSRDEMTLDDLGSSYKLLFEETT